MKSLSSIFDGRNRDDHGLNESQLAEYRALESILVHHIGEPLKRIADATERIAASESFSPQDRAAIQDATAKIKANTAKMMAVVAATDPTKQ